MSATDAEFEASERPPLRFSYVLGPFLLDSELRIPELRGGRPAGRIEVRIEVGPVSRAVPGTRAYDELCSVGPRDYLLHIPEVARFHVADGRRVTIELLSAAGTDVSAFLLGSVFGALCHQNGLLPLHASSVAWGGGVAAFLGASGAGKSTLAACLRERGYRIFSDDICLLEESEEGVRAVPVAGWLKLWRESLDYLRMQPQEQDRVFAKEDKFRMYLEGEQGTERLPLRAVVFLTRAADAQTARLVPLPAAETIAGMMELTYLAYVPALNGAEVELFQRCGRVLRGVRGYRLEMPWELARMAEVVNVLEGELLMA